MTERKNVLSTLFWMLSVWAYLEYLRKPVWQHYLGIMGFLVLGLMSKQMLVTLPCALLLLDYWPLKRLGDNWKEVRERLPRLALEKLPLFAAVVGAGLLTPSLPLTAMMPCPAWKGFPWGLVCPMPLWPMLFISKK